MENQFHSKANRSQHNLVFAAWLVQEFGQDFLRSGSGVLDVAGGAGTLSYELAVRYGISSTVWDQRDIALSSMLRRKIKKLTRARIRFCKHTVEGEEKDVPASADESLVADQSELMNWVRHVARLNPPDDGFVTSTVSECLEDPSKLPFRQIQCPFPLRFASSSELPSDADSPFENFESLNSIMSATSIVVGMHPDQVTVAIVDAALRFRRPFAVVPCCVFKDSFPERKLSSGKPVETYEDLIEFILQKNDDIIRVNLPFMGRNVVLFHAGQYGHSECSSNAAVLPSISDLRPVVPRSSDGSEVCTVEHEQLDEQDIVSGALKKKRRNTCFN